MGKPHWCSKPRSPAAQPPAEGRHRHGDPNTSACQLIEAPFCPWGDGRLDFRKHQCPAACSPLIINPPITSTEGRLHVFWHLLSCRRRRCLTEEKITDACIFAGTGSPLGCCLLLQRCLLVSVVAFDHGRRSQRVCSSASQQDTLKD